MSETAAKASYPWVAIVGGRPIEVDWDTHKVTEDGAIVVDVSDMHGRCSRVIAWPETQGRHLRDAAFKALYGVSEKAEQDNKYRTFRLLPENPQKGLEFAFAPAPAVNASGIDVMILGDGTATRLLDDKTLTEQGVTSGARVRLEPRMVQA